MCLGLFGLYASALSAEETAIPVPYYLQGDDAPWAEEKLGLNSSVTIRTHGCALTAISMVFAYFTGEDTDPSVMNGWLKRNGGFEDDPDRRNYSGRVILNWPALTDYGEGWVYTRFDWRAKPADLLLIDYYLGRGVPVIAEVLYKGAPHYVVLTGRDAARGYSMLDPELPDERWLNEVYAVSDRYGSGPSRNIYGIRVLYPAGFGRQN